MLKPLARERASSSLKNDREAEKSEVMKQQKCNACGRAIEAGKAVEHHIVPEDVQRLLNTADSSKAPLCTNCSREVADWYRGKISDVTYDSNLKRFRTKSPSEIINEYHKAYQVFLNFKGNRQKRVLKA
jgi:hypothetical protein